MSILVLQILLIALAGSIIFLWVVYFPYPSPLVRRLLPPRRRWPEGQIRLWLERGHCDRSFLRYFYRDPERKAPEGTDILAPADGIVTSADTRGGVRYLVIALSFWDMHVQRSPEAGTVTEVIAAGAEFMDGEGRDFAFLREKRCPVQKRVTLTTSRGEMAIRLITSMAARRIETWVTTGQQIERGERIGRILLGSTVVLEIKDNAEVLVRLGERVRAGETPVARLVSNDR